MVLSGETKNVEILFVHALTQSEKPLTCKQKNYYGFSIVREKFILILFQKIKTTFNWYVSIQSVSKNVIHTFRVYFSSQHSFRIYTLVLLISSRLGFGQRHFILKCCWKQEKAVEIQKCYRRYFHSRSPTSFTI